MEWDVVFAEELVELDVFWIPPPLLPVFGVVCRYGDVPDASIEPDVENLVLVPG